MNNETIKNEDYEYLKDIAINKVNKIKDSEHMLSHVYDVLYYI